MCLQRTQTATNHSRRGPASSRAATRLRCSTHMLKHFCWLALTGHVRRAAYVALLLLCGSQLVRQLRPPVRHRSVQAASALVFISPLLGLKCGRDTLCLQKERNAVASWALLSTAVAPAQLHILGFVEDAASCDPVVQATSHVTCLGVPQCVHEETGILTVDCIAREAFSRANLLVGLVHRMFVLVNADIIFTSSLTSAIRAAHSRFSANFVLVGRRVDTPLENLVASPKHAAKMVRAAEAVRIAAGRNHSVFGLDYFVFAAASFPANLPPFLVGRYRWDNVLALEFLTGSVAVVDATESVSCIHQGYTVNASTPNHIARHGARINAELATAHSGDAHLLGRIDNAPWRLVGVCPACSVVRQTPKLGWAVSARRWAHSRTRMLLLLPVRNTSALDAVIYWSRWMHDRQVDNYLLLACDRDTFDVLTAARLRVELLPDGGANNARLLEQRSCAWRIREAVSRLLRFSIAPILLSPSLASEPRICASLLEPRIEAATLHMSKVPDGSRSPPAVLAASVQPTNLGQSFWSALKRCKVPASVSLTGEHALLDGICAAKTCLGAAQACLVLRV